MSPPLCRHLLPGVHDADTVTWASQGAPWTKVSDARAIPLVAAQRSKVFYRPCFLPGDSGEGDCSDVLKWAGLVATAIREAGGNWPDAIGFRNEMNPTVANVAQYQSYRAALRASGYKGMVVFGSFGVGRPDWPQWKPMVQMFLTNPPDAIELHEYFGLTVNFAKAQELALRHLIVYDNGYVPEDWPCFIGEFNSDDVGADNVYEDGLRRRGWNDRGKLSPVAAAQQFQVYTGACHPAVVAVFVYVDGNNGDPQWASYTTRGHAEIEAVERATWGTPPMLYGIDVSSLQPGTNWPLVARSRRMAFIKATEGTGYRNPIFASDWAGALGMVRTAYHFARPDVNGPQAEADYFLAWVAPLLRQGDNVALDFEVGNGDLRGWAETWVQRVQQRLGYQTIYFYSYPYFLTEHNLLGSAILGSCLLWYASYQQTWPPVPRGWNEITVWQHSDNASVPGVAGLVDEDVSTHSEDQLRQFGQPPPQVIPNGGLMDALTYYQQLGLKIDPSHGLYLHNLKPRYDYWEQHQNDQIDGVVIGDLIKPGPLTGEEYGATWGNGRPASQVHLSNGIAGVYQAEDGSWNHPYQASLP